MSKTNFNDGQSFDFYKPHKNAGVSDWGPSLTRQEFSEECDINNIMARYEVTGVLPVNSAQPMYVDFSAIPDFQDSMQLMIDAEAAFMRLPAVVRKEFENDPRQFVEFASNGENLEQMRTWGLAPPAEVPDAIKEPAAAPAPAASAPPTQ